MRKLLSIIGLMLALCVPVGATQPAIVGTPTCANGPSGGGGSISLSPPTGAVSGSTVLTVTISLMEGTTGVTPPAGWSTVLSACNNSGAGTSYSEISLFSKVYNSGDSTPYVFSVVSASPYSVGCIEGWSNAATSLESATCGANAHGSSTAVGTATKTSVTPSTTGGTLVDIESVPLGTATLSGFNGALTALAWSVATNGPTKTAGLYQTAAAGSGATTAYSSSISASEPYEDIVFMVDAGTGTPPSAGAGVFWIP